VPVAPPATLLHGSSTGGAGSVPAFSAAETQHADSGFGESTDSPSVLTIPGTKPQPRWLWPALGGALALGLAVTGLALWSGDAQVADAPSDATSGKELAASPPGATEPASATEAEAEPVAEAPMAVGPSVASVDTPAPAASDPPPPQEAVKKQSAPAKARSQAGSAERPKPKPKATPTKKKSSEVDVGF
jgi:hypothetical protein